jgi:hypothetical protein
MRLFGETVGKLLKPVVLTHVYRKHEKRYEDQKGIKDGQKNKKTIGWKLKSK